MPLGQHAVLSLPHFTFAPLHRSSAPICTFAPFNRPRSPLFTPPLVGLSCLEVGLALRANLAASGRDRTTCGPTSRASPSGRGATASRPFAIGSGYVAQLHLGYSHPPSPIPALKMQLGQHAVLSLPQSLSRRTAAHNPLSPCHLVHVSPESTPCHRAIARTKCRLASSPPTRCRGGGGSARRAARNSRRCVLG